MLCLVFRDAEVWRDELRRVGGVQKPLFAVTALPAYSRRLRLFGYLSSTSFHKFSADERPVEDQP